jgi:hypothetical protein
MAANTAKDRRLALEQAILENNQTIEGQLRRKQLLDQQLRDVKAEEEREQSKQVHIERINALLETARMALEEAGIIGEEHGIDFVFQGPREEIDFNVNWMSSDCYGSNRWYDQGYNPNR